MYKNRIGVEKVYIKLEGNEYPLAFNLQALIDIDKELGYLQFINAINDGDEAMKIKAVKVALKYASPNEDLTKIIKYPHLKEAIRVILKGLAVNMPQVKKSKYNRNSKSQLNMFETYYYLGIMHTGLSKEEVLSSSLKELYLFIDIKNKLTEKEQPSLESIL